MSSIKSIRAKKILDSRGNPTVELSLSTEQGTFNASVPSGISTGIYEAISLKDISKVIFNIEKIIAPKIIGMNPEKQEEIDNLMKKLDGTENKRKLGANSILPVSMAVCRAGAISKSLPLYKYIRKLSGNKKYSLPTPVFNLIEGGKHSENKIPIQEFLTFPIKTKSFKEALEIGKQIYSNLKRILKEKNLSLNLGDEGGFAPDFENIEEVFQTLKKAILESNCDKVRLGIDSAASEFFKNGKYDLNFKYANNKLLKTGDEMIEFYRDLIQKYSLISIEDPFDQNDWNNYKKFNKQINKKIQIVGDDLLATNPKRIKQAIKNKLCNCLLLKINQIGTITESIQACKLAQNAGWKIMISHRGRETKDSFIADLAVGLNAEQIKSGAPYPAERMAKYLRLLEIEEEIKRE